MNIDKIVEVVAIYNGVSVDELMIKTRKRELLFPRQQAHYFAHKFTNYSLCKIGIDIGNKDHTTVIHSIKTVENLIETDKNISIKLKEIESELTYLRNKEESRYINPISRQLKSNRVSSIRNKLSYNVSLNINL